MRVLPVADYSEELAGNAALGVVQRRMPSQRRAADARPLQQRLLRARLPGRRNGIELVEGADLFVDEGRVYMRTPRGRSAST